jgi:hypothetical protein
MTGVEEVTAALGSSAACRALGRKTLFAANSCLDQPTNKGLNQSPQTTHPHTKLMTSGAAKSLTRSGRPFHVSRQEPPREHR